MTDEQILVVPRNELNDLVTFRGFRRAGQLAPEDLWSKAAFKPRPAMEEDPSYKQLIPYIVLRCEDNIFRYWRTKKGGESRLHHLYSVGVGGHINPRDENLFTDEREVMLEAAMRELKEEVRLEGDPQLKWVGWINDDDSEVGRVHLGVAYEAWLRSPRAELNEQALGRGEWKPVDQLLDGVEYETWSRFLIEQHLNP